MTIQSNILGSFGIVVPGEPNSPKICLPVFSVANWTDESFERVVE